ncbi:MAG: Methyltransferase type 11 [Mucilaginibacter sp.]|uniref:class I SAM-dependent methyltransferase n=1 Tax=Mucilaginibacter sp. TaxID=1882438 RepID=UPI002624DF94|nr:class I SAM-dependent methyltransferase [Mucilaginibacter sp.]MDB5002307.1 Methyltransferase type 11 [Mucilaginibacter sp.]
MENSDNINFIINAVNEYLKQNPTDKHVGHIDNYPGVIMYYRDANTIAKYLKSESKILDWGCGYGQMSYLMTEKGYTVDACDWNISPNIPQLLDYRIKYTQFTSPTKIDAADNSYDAVISSGTLEHANNIMESLKEIRRILKPGGWFFMFRFPAEDSISEMVAKKSGGWSHSIRMSKDEVKYMLRLHSFRIQEIGYDSFLPIMLSSKLRGLRKLRAKYDAPIHKLDKLLTNTPFINRFSTSIYCLAQVNNEYDNTYL